MVTTTDAVTAGTTRPPRLNPTDLSFLVYEAAHPTVAAEIGAVLQVDGTPPTVAELREHVHARLALLPRLTWRLPKARPRLLRPRWERCEEVDLSRHVREYAGATGLRAAVDDLLTQRIDHSAPLWELWLVHGYSERQFAVVYKVHHAVHDGVSISDVAQTLFSPAPEYSRAKESTEVPAGSKWGRALRRMRGLWSVAADLTHLAPRSPVNGVHSGRRSLVWCSAPLEPLRRAEGATVNDVFLAALTDALRVWMARGGELPADQLRALVPVSIRRPDERGALGNRLAAIRIALPTTNANPADTLTMVASDTGRAKRQGRVAAAAMVADGATTLPAPMTRGVGELSWHPRLVNLIASNMRGPAGGLSLLGRPVESFVVVNFTPEHHLVSVTLMSYQDRVFVAFAGDATLAGLDDLPGLWLAAIDRILPLSN